MRKLLVLMLAATQIIVLSACGKTKDTAGDIEEEYTIPNGAIKFTLENISGVHFI
jgi:predicted small lipoprotein YifL